MKTIIITLTLLISIAFSGYSKGKRGSNKKSYNDNKSNSWSKTKSTPSPTTPSPTPSDEDLCACYQVDLVCEPVIIGNERCYYYTIEKTSDSDYCKPIEYISLGTGDLDECGLESSDIEGLLLDYAPKCYKPDTTYDGSCNGNTDGVPGIKLTLDSDQDEDGYIIFSLCFDAESVGGLQENGQIGIKSGYGRYTCDTPNLLPNFCYDTTTSSPVTTLVPETTQDPVSETVPATTQPPLVTTQAPLTTTTGAVIDTTIPQTTTNPTTTATSEIESTEGPPRTTTDPQTTTQATGTTQATATTQVTGTTTPVTTQPPLVTTQAPLITTQAPLTTTQATDTTTTGAVIDTTIPQTTTQPPLITTQAPLVTTQAPLITTQAPLTTQTTGSTQATGTTQPPLITTQAPLITTQAPITTTLGTTQATETTQTTGTTQATGTTQRSTTPSPTQAPTFTTCNSTDEIDVAFVLDESGSVDEDEWNDIVTFVDRIISFDLSDNSYVAIWEYAALPAFAQILDFTRVGDDRNLPGDTLAASRYTSAGQTETWDAVNRVLDAFYDYNTIDGIADGSNTRKDILFLVTDGEPTGTDVCPDMIPRVTSSFVDIVIVFIDPTGILDESKVDCLDENDNQMDVIKLESFDSDAFNAIEAQIRQKTCSDLNPADPAGVPIDQQWDYGNSTFGLGPVPTQGGGGQGGAADP